MTTKTRKHLYAFGWAVLSGSVMAVAEAYRTPSFDWADVGATAFLGGVLGAAAYLRQPPRRTWTHQERQAAWELQEAKKQLELAKDDPQSQASPNAPVAASVQAPICFEEDDPTKPKPKP